MSIGRKIFGRVNRYWWQVARKTKWGWHFFLAKQLSYRLSSLKAGVKANQQATNKLFDLRRNIHRLEKGLSYEVQKRSFAADYIYQTVNLLHGKKTLANMDVSTERWAVSVLNQYFATVERSDKRIAKSYELYKTLEHKDDQYHYFPYKIDQRHVSKLTYQDMLDLSLQRRSVRYYEDRRLTSDQIQEIFEIAKLSPSACNRQSFRFLFYNEKSIVDKLSKIPGGVSGYELYNVVVVVGDHAGYFDVRDVNAPLIDASLASMSFLYAAETVGLATVCINWPNIPAKEKAIREVVELSDSEFIVMLIGIGYPSEKGKIPYSKKRDNHDFILINERIR